MAASGSGNRRTKKAAAPVNPMLPMKAEPRCNICKSASRQLVDKLIVSGFSYIDIAEELVARDQEFQGKELDTVRKNVERHAKRHVNVREKAMRQIIERRAMEQGILIDEATGNLTTGRALLDNIIVRANEMIADPDQRVKFADAIEAVKMLEDVQKSEYLAQVESMQKQVWAISQAVKEMIPEDLVGPLVKRAEELYKNPQLEA